MSGRRWGGCAGLLVLVLVGVLSAWLLYHVFVAPREVVATVSGMRWSRGVHVERARSVRHQAHELPPGARLQGVVPVPVGWRDVPELGTPYGRDRAEAGDTVFRREPVFVPRYTFEVEAWEQDTAFQASGSTEPPRWPEVELAPGQRRAGRFESYTLEFTDAHDNLYVASMVRPDEFVRWKVGQTARLSVYEGGQSVKILGPAGAEKDD